MTSRRTARFKSLFGQLPVEVQLSAQRAYVLFQRDASPPVYSSNVCALPGSHTPFGLVLAIAPWVSDSMRP